MSVIYLSMYFKLLFFLSVQSACIPPQLFFFFFKKKLLTFSVHVVFAPDEVEFQEDGKSRLACASRCSEEVYAGLDSTKNDACCVCVLVSIYFSLHFVFYLPMFVRFLCI